MTETAKMPDTRNRLRDTVVAACLGACLLAALFWLGRSGVPSRENLAEAVRAHIGPADPLPVTLVAVDVPSWKRLDAERFEGEAFLVFEVSAAIHTLPHMAGLRPYIDVWEKAHGTLSQVAPLKDVPAEAAGTLRREMPENPFAKEMFALRRHAPGDVIRIPHSLRGKREGGRITETNVPRLFSFPEMEALRKETEAYERVAATSALVDVSSPAFAEKSAAFAESVEAFAARVAAVKGEYLSALLGNALDSGTVYLKDDYGLLIKKRDFAKGVVQGREIFLDSKRQTAFTGRLVLTTDAGKQRPAMVYTSARDNRERTVFIGEKILYFRLDGEPQGVAFLTAPEEARKALAGSGLGLDLPPVW